MTCLLSNIEEINYTETRLRVQITKMLMLNGGARVSIVVIVKFLKDQKWKIKRKQMILLLFLSHIGFSLPDEMPILISECPLNTSYDWFGYNCLPNNNFSTSSINPFLNRNRQGKKYRRIDFTGIIAPENVVSTYVDTCDGIIYEEHLFCYISKPNTTELKKLVTVREGLSYNVKDLKQFTINFRNVIGSQATATGTMNATILDSLVDALFRYGLLEEDDQQAIEYASNLCVLSHYDSNSDACKFLSTMMPLIGNEKYYRYQFWNTRYPFISFENTPINYILEEDLVAQTFKFNDIVTITLAQYSRTGEFKGFKNLNLELQRCGAPNDIINSWRKFGYNYFSKCSVNVGDLFDKDSTDFYEPFLQDIVKDKIVLRPIPVISMNYIESNNEVNRNRDERTTRAVRRFFIQDNYTTNEYIQIIDSINITFSVKDRAIALNAPKIEIEYITARAGSPVEHEFQFNVLYTKDLSSFWNAAQILIGVILALALVYFIYLIFMTLRYNGQGNFKLSVILTLVAHVLDTFGAAFFILTFAFALYVLVFFKWQKSGYFFLPPAEEFELLIPFIWTSFCCKAIAIILYIISMTSLDVFIIDWENPKEDEMPVSAWRKILVANEWNRVLTVRSYSTPFTLLVMIFILQGLDLQLMATPIPSTKLIDNGTTNSVLRFAFSSFIWLILMIVEGLWSNLIYWRFFGNPFLNFVDLCFTSNISTYIRISPFHGFYIHGRKFFPHADEDMETLEQNLQDEQRNLTPERGLVPGTSATVFETFFTTDLRLEFSDLYNAMLAQTGAPSVIGCKRHLAGDIPKETYETYKEVNKFMKDFLEKKSKNHNFIVQEQSIAQQMIGAIPTVVDDSVLSVVNDSKYKKSLLAGLEWKIALFYLIMFACIDVATESPCIAAFVVFIIDQILIKIVETMGRANLSRKTLLDDRFCL